MKMVAEAARGLREMRGPGLRAPEAHAGLRSWPWAGTGGVVAMVPGAGAWPWAWGPRLRRAVERRLIAPGRAPSLSAAHCRGPLLDRKGPPPAPPCSKTKNRRGDPPARR